MCRTLPCANCSCHGAFRGGLHRFSNVQRTRLSHNYLYKKKELNNTITKDLFSRHLFNLDTLGSSREEKCRNETKLGLLSMESYTIVVTDTEFQVGRALLLLVGGCFCHLFPKDWINRPADIKQLAGIRMQQVIFQSVGNLCQMTQIEILTFQQP